MRWSQHRSLTEEERNRRTYDRDWEYEEVCTRRSKDETGSAMANRRLELCGVLSLSLRR